MVAIIDDDASIRRALWRLLKSHGVPAAQFGSAEEFLAASRNAVFALLLVDVAMGGMGGLDLLESLAAEGRSAPAVVITADTAASTRQRARLLGAPVLNKPIEMSELLAHVEAALGLKLRPGS